MSEENMRVSGKFIAITVAKIAVIVAILVHYGLVVLIGAYLSFLLMRFLSEGEGHQVKSWKSFRKERRERREWKREEWKKVFYWLRKWTRELRENPREFISYLIAFWYNEIEYRIRCFIQRTSLEHVSKDEMPKAKKRYAVYAITIAIFLAFVYIVLGPFLAACAAIIMFCVRFFYRELYFWLDDRKRKKIEKREIIEGKREKEKKYANLWERIRFTFGRIIITFDIITILLVIITLIMIIAKVVIQ